MKQLSSSGSSSDPDEPLQEHQGSETGIGAIFHIDAAPYDEDTCDASVEALQEHYNFFYILAQVKLLEPGLLEPDREDIALEVTRQFWAKLSTEHIEKPRSYLHQMIRRHCIDFARYNKRRVQQIHATSEGWNILEESQLAIAHSEGMNDPAEEYEQKEGLEDFAEELAEGLLKLHPQQQQAARCFLYERIGNNPQYIATLKRRRIEPVALWPTDKKARQLLKASLSPALCHLAAYLHVDLSQYKHRQQHRTRTNPSHRPRNSVNV
ncbi:MAG TPA: hypothetical protein VFA41_12660 [Ktedonobacteraceae bacterium]|jgi:DNA-directed RNA polymerase specialized sigma24 family protein|nr:hypothetical protein [Ktedonobacteraceae bacterium]